MSKEVLLQARELINRKRYSDARKLLRTIPLDPTARKWLTKLDEIAPEKKSLLEKAKSTDEVRAPSKSVNDNDSEVSYWRMGAIVMAFLVVVAAVFLVARSPQVRGCDGQMRDWWDDDAESAVLDFLDTAETAASTSRIAASPLVLELRSIQRDFERLDYPQCGEAERDLINDGMSLAVDGFNSFLGQQDFLADVQLEDSSEKLAEAYDLLWDRNIFADTRMSNASTFIW